MPQLTESITTQIEQRAIQKAQEIGVNVCIAITDSGAHLCSFYRMDNAFTGSIDVSIGKARTSSMFPMPSGAFGKLIRDNELTGMELSNQSLIGFPGGLPIRIGDVQVGAIGISGATAAQDEEIALFAISEVGQ